jgi:DNA-binding MarR family transcriptional regulator
MPRPKPSAKSAKYTGRAQSWSFLRLPHYIVESEQFDALSCSAVKLLMQIGAKYRGSNNGAIGVPWDEMRRRGWRSKATLQAARDELVDAGWIQISRHGHNRLCNLYAITWEAVDECPGYRTELQSTTRPSNLWRMKSAPQKLGRKKKYAPETVPLAA